MTSQPPSASSSATAPTQPYDGYEIARSIEEAARRARRRGHPRRPSCAPSSRSRSSTRSPAQQLDEAVIQVALQNVKDDPAFDTIASRLLVKTLYKRVFGEGVTRDEVDAFHGSAFVSSILRGVELGLLDTRLAELFDLEVLGAALDPTPRRPAALHRRADDAHPLHDLRARRHPARGAAVLLDAGRDGALAQRGGAHRGRDRASTTRCRAWSTSPPAPRWSTRARLRPALQLLRHADGRRHRAHRQERARRHVADQGHRRHRPVGHQAARRGLADPVQQHRLDRARSRSCTPSTRRCARSAAAARSSARCASTWRTGTSTSPSSSTCGRTPATPTAAPAPPTPPSGSATSS